MNVFYAERYKNSHDVMDAVLAYGNDFKEIVVSHIQDTLRHAEWSRLRALSLNLMRRPPAARSLVIGEHITPEEFVDQALECSSISVNESLIMDFKQLSVKIGEVAEQPVFYVQGRGIYMWGLDQDHGDSLSVWLTYPAYPEGW
jgi:hypothetical protein